MKYVYKIFLIIGLIFITSSGIAAIVKDEPGIRTAVDKKFIFIGDRVRYTIEIKSREDLDVEFPKFDQEKIGDFDIKDSGSGIKKPIFGKRTTSHWYDITTYAIGKHLIPSVEVKHRRRGKKDWDVLKTDSMTVTVESVLPKDKNVRDIKDIKGPIYFREINWPLILGALAISASSIIGIVKYNKMRKRRRSKLPHEIALEELDYIKELLSKTGDVKEYYIRISDCVRQYIERTFSLRAPEMTTEEFLVSLKDSEKLSSNHKNLLKEFLEACDLVKFAKYAPNRSEIDSVYTKARDFVDETKVIFLIQESSK